MLTLCGLYVAQGIPWGFVTVTFAAWLAQPKNGLTAEEIGPILAVATLPWSFKFLWGPLMDRFTILRFGRRRPWIIFAQSMAILVLGSMLLIEDLPGMVWTEAPESGALQRAIYSFIPGPLAGLILLANIFISLQDVAVDALAVDLLAEEERGTANGLMYGSSYFGTAVGGAGLGYLVANYGIRAGLLGQAILLSLIMLLPLLIRERPDRSSDKDVPEEDGMRPHAEVDFGETPFLPPEDARQSGTESIVATESVFGNLFRAFSLRATLIGGLVAISVRIGVGVLTAVFVDYLMKGGGWQQSEYTQITGGYAVLLGLVGSAMGGYIADKFGAKKMIAITSILVGTLWISFGMIPASIESKAAVKFMLLSQEFLLAVMSVSLFALFMSISWPRVAATQFTAYMALMNLSTTIGSYTAGMLSSRLSILEILIVAGVLQAILVLPVLLIDPKQTRRVLGDS